MSSVETQKFAWRDLPADCTIPTSDENAHDLPFAGHLGREKTALRILRQFYWPTLFQDVRRYCRSCGERQLHGGPRMKAPMIPCLWLENPFKRIAMDIVGPLPRTRKGNRFILAVSDYAT